MVDERTKGRLRDRKLILVLVAYLLLALAYGTVNPMFEAPDEHWHYFTAQQIAETGRLPVVEEEPDPWLGQEAAQPPLYYALSALLIRPLDTDGARETAWPNPFVRMGDASSPTNINAFVHGPWEGWPWRGYVLAVHLLRAFSSLLGMGTLLCLYRMGRLLWPERRERALLAVAMVAFLPQFLFVHSAVTNDALITLLAAAALWQLLHVWLHGATRRRLLFLGVTVGLAILTKTAGLLLLAYVIGVLLLLSWRERRPKIAITATLYVLLPAALIGGWLLYRNWALYGDPTAANQFVRVAGGDREYNLANALAEMPGLWTSLFAVFGWFNVRAPQWVYWLWNGLVALSLAGAVRHLGLLWRNRDRGMKKLFRGGNRRWVPWLLAAWALMVFAGLLAFMLRTPAAQGRLLFPALAPLALGFVYGLSNLPWPAVRVAAPLLALVTSLAPLITVIPAAYAQPPVMTEAEIPEGASWLEADVGQGLELLAAEVETRAAQPGETVWLTLYWRAAQRPEAAPKVAPEVVVELFGREGEEDPVGRLHSYHAGGRYPATLWPPGQVVAARTGVRLEESMLTPAEVRVQVGVAGEAERVTAGALKAIPETWPAGHDTLLARLGDGIVLAQASVNESAVRPGERLVVTVEWQVTAAPGRRLTTFVHLGDPAAPPLAQGDSPPLGGDYPTIWWEAGEVIRDGYEVEVPQDVAAGQYPLLIGMYDPETGQRVPLTSGGERQPNDAYVLAWITVQ